jgi:hypothetical protein
MTLLLANCLDLNQGSTDFGVFFAPPPVFSRVWEKTTRRDAL